MDDALTTRTIRDALLRAGAILAESHADQTTADELLRRANLKRQRAAKLLSDLHDRIRELERAQALRQ